MVKTSIELLAQEIGFDIGMSDDVTQVKLINGLSKGLVNLMNSSRLDDQCCYIVNKLESESIKLIKILNEFIDIKEGKGK